MLDPGQEKRIGHILVTGIVFIPLGIVFFAVSSIGGLVAVARPGDNSSLYMMIGSLSLSVFGVGLVVFAIAKGAMRNRAMSNSTTVQVAQKCMALARFAVDSDNNMISETDADVVPGAKFYVRIALQNGTRAEFRTAFDVFLTVGEGQWGMAEFQGEWLGRWTPTVSPSATQENPYA